MKVTPELEELARDFASPIILRILRRYTGQELAQAVKEDLDIVKGLKENSRTLSWLRLILTPFPQVDQVGPYISSTSWLRWFIENELKHKRSDLHLQFTYDPDAFKWLQKNMVKLSEFLFE